MKHNEPFFPKYPKKDFYIADNDDVVELRKRIEKIEEWLGMKE